MIPLLWINLRRHEQRRRRMEWALEEGGWWHERIEAVDAQDPTQRLWPVPNPLHRGNDLPGIQRRSEADPQRQVLRAELACTASWLRVLCRGWQLLKSSGHQQLLVMEDDCGASLARPEAWAFSLHEFVDELDQRSAALGVPWQVVQLLPTSCRAQATLLQTWQSSGGQCRATLRQEVRSGGTGAVLLHRRCLPRLINGVQRWLARHRATWHLLSHPWGVRPLADKWLYGSVPENSVWVPTYPLFCLDASGSAIHPDHVEAFQNPSKALVMRLWKRDRRSSLISAQLLWDDHSF